MSNQVTIDFCDEDGLPLYWWAAFLRTFLSDWSGIDFRKTLELHNIVSAQSAKGKVTFTSEKYVTMFLLKYS